MECKTVKELRQLCKTNGIKGYSKWKKQKLIDELSKDSLDNQGNKTKAKLIELCVAKDIKVHSK